MRKFDTKVQYLKYKVLREVARHAWNDTLLESVMDIPKTIVPGKVPTMRCCVYKERAILGERVKLAMGGDFDNPNVMHAMNVRRPDMRLRPLVVVVWQIAVKMYVSVEQFLLTIIMWHILISLSV